MLQANRCENCQYCKKVTPDLKDISMKVMTCCYYPPLPVLIPTREGPTVQSCNPMVTPDHTCSKFQVKIAIQ